MAITNAASPLTIPTYDGSGQATHPTVIDFQTEHGITWGGHRFWMCMTPYPSSQSYYENPSLLCSDDGITWSVPAGITNPLDGPPADADGSVHHYADPGMVYDPTSGDLIIFHIEGHGGTTSSPVYIRRIDVASDMTVTKRGIIITSTRSMLMVSPAVVIDSGTWHMWYVSLYPEGGGPGGAGTFDICYRTSADGMTWGEPTVCTPALSTINSRYPWHLDAKKRGAAIDLLINSTSRASLGPATGNGELHFAHTTLAAPTTLTYEPAAALVGTDGWDDTIYRAAFVPDGDYNTVWYSAYSGTGSTWGIGMTTDVPEADPAHLVGDLLSTIIPAYLVGDLLADVQLGPFSVRLSGTDAPSLHIGSDGDTSARLTGADPTTLRLGGE